MIWVWWVACGNDGRETAAPKPSDPSCNTVEVPYDGVDQDCADGDLRDVDGDGFEGEPVGGEDCDDHDPDRSPAAEDVPYDGFDQDCSGADLVDVDGDGSAGLEAGGDDCDDEEPTVSPGADDPFGDDVDADCDGADGVDADADGWASIASGARDCDDVDPTVHPRADDPPYDGIDQDCLGDCDYDVDQDGAVPAEWLDVIVAGSSCDGNPTREDCDDLNADASGQAVVSISPPDGAVDVDVDLPLVLVVRESQYDVRVRVLDPDGNEIPTAAYAQFGNLEYRIHATQDSGVIGEPYPGLTELTVEVTHSCGVETSRFTTGPGMEAVDPGSLVGTTWAIVPIAMGGPAFTLAWYIPFYAEPLAYVAVTGSDGTGLDLRIAAAAMGGQQDPCQPTDEVYTDFATNPWIVASPIDIALGLPGYTPTVVDATLSVGVYDGTLIDWTHTGYVDGRKIAPVTGFTPDFFCTEWGCVACPDGTGSFCLVDETLIGGVMPNVEMVVVPITAEEVAANPDCP